MSILPEYILQQTLVRGFRAIREDNRIIGALFRNLRQDDLASLQEYFRDNAIDLSLNYPDSDLKLPAVTILLKSENESDSFLGNLMQDHASLRRTGVPFHTDELAGDAATVGGGSTGKVTSTSPAVLMTAVTATGGSATTVTIPAGTFVLYDPFEEESYISIIEGTGEGQTRQVINIDPSGPGGETVITVTPTWNIPDATSVVRITRAPDEEGVTGEPSKMFFDQDVLERVGAHYHVVYQALCLGSTPEIAIYLYNIVKAIMFLNVNFLVKQGFLNMTMSGSDFLPRTEFYPGLAYQRALNLEFDYSFDLYRVTEDNLLDQLVVSLTVHDPDVGDYEDIETIVSETTVDLVP